MDQDLLFDYEKEAWVFLQNKIFTGLDSSDTSLNLLNATAEFAKESNIIIATPVNIESTEDVSEILLPKIKYAIKNEDIKILDAILDGLKAAAAANYFQGNVSDKTISAITGIIAALLKLGRDVLKGVRLNEAELLILIELKSAGPLGLEILSKQIVAKGMEIEEGELLLLLGNLSQKKSIIGTNVSLVAKTTDGRWVTSI